MIQAPKLGLVVGSVAAAWHIVWSVLAAADLAQPLIDWMQKLHFMEPSMVLNAFDPGKAIVLIVIAFLIGYVTGWFAGTVWNTVAKKA